MDEFLYAVCQTLRNLGADAAFYPGKLVLQGVQFQASRRGQTAFRFCGRTYKKGNVLQATIDLLRQLPSLLAERDKYLALAAERLRLAALNKRLKEHNLRLSGGGDVWTLTFTSDLATCQKLAEQIMNAQDVSFASIDEALAKVTFTSEGGFSLN